MIDCAQYRRAVLADPRTADLELRAHRDGCPECARYTERLMRFEGRVERALRVSAPPARPAADPAQAAARARPRGAARLRFTADNRARLAMAATVLIVVAAIAGLWLGSPQRSLAADVIAHMAGEPQAWARTGAAVASGDLDQVLRDSRMRLRPSVGTVSYARSCPFRGQHVPHLVVQTDMGPVTVMVLVHESVPRAVPFDESGYSGVIVPVAGHGSLAVLARGHNIDMNAVRRVAASVQGAIDWTR